MRRRSRAESGRPVGGSATAGKQGGAGAGPPRVPETPALQRRTLLGSAMASGEHPIRARGPRRLSARQIEVFRAVMVAGSLSGAAQQLNVSQPSLTRLVRRIEDQVGFALFDRVKGRLLPTAEARMVFAKLQDRKSTRLNSSHANISYA